VVTPGLLPETPPRRALPIGLGIFGLLVVIALAVWWIRADRREDEQNPFVIPVAPLAKSSPDDLSRRVRELEARIAQLEAERRPPDAPIPPAERAPDLRVIPPVRDPRAEERRDLGFREFRAGRYELAEAHFFRILPEGYVYLVLSGIARTDYREALEFLARARAADPVWFRRVVPAQLFGSPEEYRQHREALEARVREHPLDAEAKILLAYLYYHEKGSGYAQALLLEVTAADPDNVEAKEFLRNLER
jgi:hypothetical protein